MDVPGSAWQWVCHHQGRFQQQTPKRPDQPQVTMVSGMEAGTAGTGIDSTQLGKHRVWNEKKEAREPLVLEM